MIDYCRHHWYNIGGILFIALSFFLAFRNSALSRIQVILLSSFMGMLVHQMEEYAWPGGFPSMANILMCREREAYDRYPFNANQCWISNVFLTYTFYLLPVFFPNLIWLGLAQVFAGMLQIISHGFLMNIKLRSFYNPGMGATILLQWPIGIYYIYYVNAHKLAGQSAYLIGMAAAVAALCVLFFIPILLMRDRKSAYPFHEEELYGFAERKIKAMQHERKV